MWLGRAILGLVVRVLRSRVCVILIPKVRSCRLGSKTSFLSLIQFVLLLKSWGLWLLKFTPLWRISISWRRVQDWIWVWDSWILGLWHAIASSQWISLFKGIVIRSLASSIVRRESYLTVRSKILGIFVTSSTAHRGLYQRLLGSLSVHSAIRSKAFAAVLVVGNFGRHWICELGLFFGLVQVGSICELPF